MGNLDQALDEIGMTASSVTKTAKEFDKILVENGFTSNVENDEAKLMKAINDVDKASAVENKLVPASYKGAYFDEARIKNNIRIQYGNTKQAYKVVKFTEYTSTCFGILTALRLKQLPDRSFIIGAPNGFGKASFVYECLTTMLKAEMRAVPYISLTELAIIKNAEETRLMNGERFEGRNYYYGIRDERYRKDNQFSSKNKEAVELLGAYSWAEYINADCLFVFFSDITSKQIESKMLSQILSIRGAKGLPTIALISTSLDPYMMDNSLREYVWDEILDTVRESGSYDRVFHVSCYKRKKNGIMDSDENIEADTGIVRS